MRLARVVQEDVWAGRRSAPRPLTEMAMKALLKFTATVALTVLCFAAFTAYILSSSVDFGDVCGLPIVCG